VNIGFISPLVSQIDSLKSVLNLVYSFKKRELSSDQDIDENGQLNDLDSLLSVKAYQFNFSNTSVKVRAGFCGLAELEIINYYKRGAISGLFYFKKYLFRVILTRTYKS